MATEPPRGCGESGSTPQQARENLGFARPGAPGPLPGRTGAAQRGDAQVGAVAAGTEVDASGHHPDRRQAAGGEPAAAGPPARVAGLVTVELAGGGAAATVAAEHDVVRRPAARVG